MKVLITGAAGFIGMHVAQRLLARGDSVVGIDNLNDYYDVGLKEARLAQLAGRPGFRFVRLDIADTAGVAALFEKEAFDGVVNLAAQAGVRYSLINPHAYAQSNLVGFVNLLEGFDLRALHGPEPRLGRLDAPLLEHGAHLRELLAEHLEIERLLRSVVVMASGHVGAGAVGDVADRGRVEAARREELGGGGDEAIGRRALGRSGAHETDD